MSDLGFRLPDAAGPFSSLSFALPPGRFGLTGPNGGGKSTLLRLIAGEMRPTTGSVASSGSVALLPQRIDLDPAAPVSRILGVEDKLAAIEEIAEGSLDQRHYDTIGADWDVAERTEAHLAALGLGAIGLDRECGTLSGGELVLVSFAALIARRPGILLLDEPTNNLDARWRGYLMDGIGQFKGALLAVTHDRDLLDRMDRIGELRDGRLTWYDAPFSAFMEAKAAEAAARRRAVRDAQSEVRRQRRELAESQTKQARRDRAGRNNADSLPPILANTLRRRAEETAGRSKRLHEDRLAAARDQLDQAKGRLGRSSALSLELPGTQVPAGRDVLELDHVAPAHTGLDVSWHVRGPERIALTGPNGIGKTSLLRCVMGLVRPERGAVRLHVPARMLPQSLDLLDDGRSALENVAGPTPDAQQTNRARAVLAQLQLSGAKAERPVGTLSGGERWRATLAALLTRRPVPQLLVLDEPTNNLDLDAVGLLTEALAEYRGAVIVVSHDEQFLMGIEPSRRLDLSPAR
jgi:ATPase subunit of ABC transporter with duplicated ATPase domains